MSQLQNKIEQTAKEYLLYKNLFEQKLKDKDKRLEELAKSAVKTENKEEVFEKFFEVNGAIELLAVDMNQMKVKLYHYINLAEDLVEIPQEIKDLVEDYSQTFLFSTDGEIVNKPLYEQYKQMYLKAAQEVNFGAKKE